MSAILTEIHIEGYDEPIYTYLSNEGYFVIVPSRNDFCAGQKDVEVGGITINEKQAEEARTMPITQTTYHKELGRFEKDLWVNGF